MREFEFVTLDVFTDRVFGGNPLAVFLKGDSLSTEQMQRIAREMNLCETVFLCDPDKGAHRKRLRIFTPAAELPFAGHPTVGSALALELLADVSQPAVKVSSFVLETSIGSVLVDIDGSDPSLPLATIQTPRLPERGQNIERTALATALSLQPEDIMEGGFGPRIYSAGVPIIFAPLKSLEALARCRIQSSTWEEITKETHCGHVFPFTMEDWEQGRALRARMFAPSFGIPEDPATGGAVAALAGLLCDAQTPQDGSVKWVITQGVEMGRPSVIHLQVDVCNCSPAAVRLSGTAVLVSRGVFMLHETQAS